MTPRRRSRSESMIKLEQQKKEAKIWYEEANTHVKSGNLLKAQLCYDKVSYLKLSKSYFLLRAQKFVPYN